MTQQERNKLTQKYLDSIGYKGKVTVCTTKNQDNKTVFQNGIKLPHKLECFINELGYQISFKP